MATHILAPYSYAGAPLWGGLTLDVAFGDGSWFVGVGDTDLGICVQATDAKSAHSPEVPGGSYLGLYFVDDAQIPLSATINSVQVVVRHKGTVGFYLAVSDPLGFGSNGSFATFGYIDLPGADPQTFTSYQDNKSAIMTTNPVTSAPWARADLFSSDPITTVNGGWRVAVVAFDTGATYDIDKISLVVNYTAAAAWFYNPTTEHYKYDTDPGAPWVANDPTPTVDDTFVPDTVTDDVDAHIVDPVTESTVSVDAFTPGIGCSAGGDSVAITGTGFGDGATVTFGGVAAISVVVVNHKLITAITPAHADGAVDVVITQADSTTITGTGAFTYGTPWWQRLIIVVIDFQIFTFEVYVQSCSPPDTGIWVLQSLATPDFTWWYNVDLGWSSYQVDTPGTGWVDVGATPTPASNDGWYLSPVAFGGSINIISAGRPKDPRSWEDIIAWAENGTEMLGGSPAASVIFQNRMIYPSTDYTVGTTYPPIRVFDGSFDHELAKLPPTPTNGVPQAVLSMLAANGTMYLTSFDSGTTSANWLGRVFQLDLESGVLTPLGTQFAAGEMPYALAWHMGRLWCGTNNGIGTVGKVYYFRPGIDTAWTLDHSLATDSVGGVDSMISYKGRLFIGSDGAAGTFSKILVRDSSGAYTTSHTASGGTARVNNGHIAMAQFGENLYASYWNNDTAAVSLLKKFDNTTWSTVYTPTGNNIRPYIVLFVDDERLFAIGGGFDLSGALVSSANGTSWLDLTPTLAAIESNKTLLPIYGVEIF